MSHRLKHAHERFRAIRIIIHDEDTPSADWFLHDRPWQNVVGPFGHLPGAL
jgi:hypothetical protein